MLFCGYNCIFMQNFLEYECAHIDSDFILIGFTILYYKIAGLGSIILLYLITVTITTSFNLQT